MFFFFFFFKQKTAYEMLRSLVGSEMCIRDRPHLERVLNLPANSLTKEIELTQDLMTLMLEHELPSDMLSFSRETEEEQPLSAVRKHVAAMNTMIENAKRREVADLQTKAKATKVKATKAAEEETPGLFPGNPRSLPGSRGYQESHDWIGSETATTGQVNGQSNSAVSRLNTLNDQLERMRARAPPSSAQGVLAAAELAAEAAEASASQVTGPSTTPSKQQQQFVPLRSKHQSGENGEGDADDYTSIVAEMDARIEQMDPHGALRPTIIKVTDRWRKKSRKGLLGQTTSRGLTEDDQEKEKRRALGLLDALTRGGGLELHEAALHVIVVATHHFDKSVMKTVVQDNVNPVERLECSMLLLASLVHRVPVPSLVSGVHLDQTHCPSLLGAQESGSLSRAPSSSRSQVMNASTVLPLDTVPDL
eukprot:TRINITY_DN2541_c0_g1_i3.p1 TRINITY_DN2541_c0_g1~~TRINITY_DN2541_c0_g1_i3.p1  ORF type:complete len:421 (-),score=124.75 TRINITY_DN2541_c0_g1_i3:232-1494(-)